MHFLSILNEDTLYRYYLVKYVSIIKIITGSENPSTPQQSPIIPSQYPKKVIFLWKFLSIVLIPWNLLIVSYMIVGSALSDTSSQYDSLWEIITLLVFLIIFIFDFYFLLGFSSFSDRKRKNYFLFNLFFLLFPTFYFLVLYFVYSFLI